MPVLAKFCGIVIRLLSSRTLGARLHAFYGDSELIVNLLDLSIVQGDLPPRIQRMVLAWAKQHRSEVFASLGRYWYGSRAALAMA